MKEFLKKLFAFDKALHAMAGAIVFLVLWGPMGLRGIWPYVGVAAIGASKEAFDSSGSGTPDPLDFVATLLPAIAILVFQGITFLLCTASGN